MDETRYRLKDIEKEAGVENRNLFQVRKNWVKKTGKIIGVLDARAIWVTKAEAEFLLGRLGMTGQRGHGKGK